MIQRHSRELAGSPGLTRCATDPWQEEPSVALALGLRSGEVVVTVEVAHRDTIGEYQAVPSSALMSAIHDCSLIPPSYMRAHYCV